MPIMPRPDGPAKKIVKDVLKKQHEPPVDNTQAIKRDMALKRQMQRDIRR